MFSSISARERPPEPPQVVCQTCAGPVGHWWMSGAWQPAPCPACRAKAEAEAAQITRAEKAKDWLRGSSRIPERLLGYRLAPAYTTAPARNESFTAFRSRCRSGNLLGLTKENAATIARLREWVGPQSVYLCGPVGTGKSTIASAFCAHLAFTSGAMPIYVVESELWAKQADGSYLDSLAKRAHVLWLDDFGTTETPKDWQREMMEAIICERYAHRRTTIFTANAPSEEMAKRWGDRVASRLGEMVLGWTFEIGGRDWRKG